MKLKEKLRYWIHEWIYGYPPYIYRNGYKVRRTGRLSVNREDAIKANWDLIRNLSKGFKK